MSPDRRRYPRRDVRLRATQQIGNLHLPRIVTRLSPGGFFIEHAGAVARLGDLVVMEFEEAAGPLRVTGEVAYVSADGVGVQITRADWRRLSVLIGRGGE